jgi:hypothetical protein
VPKLQLRQLRADTAEWAAAAAAAAAARAAAAVATDAAARAESAAVLAAAAAASAKAVFLVLLLYFYSSCCILIFLFCLNGLIINFNAFCLFKLACSIAVTEANGGLCKGLVREQRRAIHSPALKHTNSCDCAQ